MSDEPDQQRSGGQAIVAALVSEGVDTVFGIPGVHNLPIYDALADFPEIRRVTTRHESGAAFMADGYSRAGGRPGICVASAGPGVLNTLTPLGTSYADSVPVLALTAQIPSQSMGRELGEMHDLNDQRRMLEGVTGWTTSINSTANAAWAVHEAMKRLRTQRPRPIAIETPLDVLQRTGDVPIGGPLPVTIPGPAPESIEHAIELLNSGLRTVIIAGGGAVDASAEVVAIAERLGAPVLCSSMGLGVMPWDHPLSLGTGYDLSGTMAERLSEADVVLSIGCRFTSYTTASRSLKLTGKLIHVDLDPAELGKHYPPDVGIVGDARTVLGQLLSGLGDGVAAGPAEDVSAIREAGLRGLAEVLPLEIGMVSAVREAMPRDGIISLDMTGLAYWIRRTGVAYHPRTILCPVTFGCLGYGLPAAIGAALARQESAVVAICGDAGFQFSVAELATAVQLGLHFPVIIVNDSGYSALRPRQIKQFGRAVEASLLNPNFPALAEAYGAEGVGATVETLTSSIRKALESDRMTVIEIQADLRHPEALQAIRAERMKAQAAA